MPDNLQIRRDRSALADGTLFGRRRRGLSHWKFGAWLLGMVFMGGIVWQFNQVQPTVLAWVGTAPTATPSNVTYGERGYAAYVRGDLETAIDNYCWAAHGSPQKPFSSPRCQPPDATSPDVRNANINIVYELVRALVYRTYDDRRLGTYAQDAENWGLIAVNANPKNSRAHAIYAYALVTNDKSEQAIPQGRSAISLNAKDGDAHGYLSWALYASAHYSEAVDEGAAAVSLADQSVDAHTSYAYALFVTGQNSSAQAEFEAATKINPRLAYPYFNLASFFLFRQQQEAAIVEYDQVLAMDNKSVKAYTRKCAAYFNIGETSKALENCKNATGLDASFTEAWKWQGQVLYNRRDYEDAETAFITCQQQENDAVAQKQILPQDRIPECWYLLGLTYYLLGDCPKAIGLFNETLSFTSNAQAIRLTRQGINGCAAVDPSLPTPTLIPLTPTPPAPIN